MDGRFNRLSPTSDTNQRVRVMSGNYMTWTLGLIILIGGAITAAFVIANFGMIIAILLETQDIDHDVHHLKGKVESVCDDGNQCTQGRLIHGSCEIKPFPVGTPCETACFDPEMDEGATHTCTIPKDCKDCAVCTGSVCSGRCEAPSDCPVLETNNPFFGNATSTCQQDACVYLVNTAGTFDSISVACSPESKLFVDTCLGLLEPQNALVRDGCATALPICSNATFSTLISCAYYHNCAPPTPIIII